jgi:ribosomal protein L37AE/L43A
MPELADILRLHGPAYLAKYGTRLLPSHRRAIQDITACRTAALGGHLYRCPQCQQDHYQYHSCKNRHCPKCQHEQVEHWLAQQRALLLPVGYFLATFTLPRGLRALARSHQKVVYDLLFRASQQALQTLAADPRHLGGTLGMLGVLQTWTRDLRYHPHVHYLIPGGGLARDGHTWRPARATYLVPEKPLAQLFRAKFRDLLTAAGLCS